MGRSKLIITTTATADTTTIGKVTGNDYDLK